MPGLGADLISVSKSFASSGLKGFFDDGKMYLIKGEDIVLSASHKNGVYSVDSVMPDSVYDVASNSNHIPVDKSYLHSFTKKSPAETDETILKEGNDFNPVSNPQDPRGISSFPLQTGEHNSEKIDSVWSKKEMAHKNRLNMFSLMHRRLGHVSSTALAKIHNVTTLTKPIIIPQNIPRCEVCVKANIKNRFSKMLSPHQRRPLAVISVDIAGPFPISVRGNSYFAEIIDNWSRKVWIIPLAKRSDLAVKLDELSIILERQTGEKILAARSDGAPEILGLFGDWKKKRGIISQTTAPYSSNQNGGAERAIQSSEKEARALLEDSNMPVEF